MQSLTKKRIVRRQGETFRYTEDEKRAFAKKLRNRPTRAEAILWNHLRKFRGEGVRFRRQSLVLGYIADFYCPAYRLVIEVDGSVHDEPEQKHKDFIRDRRMRAEGLRVLRFKNQQVIHSTQKVLKSILGWCNKKSIPDQQIAAEPGAYRRRGGGREVVPPTEQRSQEHPEGAAT